MEDGKDACIHPFPRSVRLSVRRPDNGIAIGTFEIIYREIV